MNGQTNWYVVGGGGGGWGKGVYVLFMITLKKFVIDWSYELILLMHELSNGALLSTHPMPWIFTGGRNRPHPPKESLFFRLFEVFVN